MWPIIPIPFNTLAKRITYFEPRELYFTSKVYQLTLRPVSFLKNICVVRSQFEKLKLVRESPVVSSQFVSYSL